MHDYLAFFCFAFQPKYAIVILFTRDPGANKRRTSLIYCPQPARF